MKSQARNGIGFMPSILWLLFSLRVEVWLTRPTLLCLMLEVHAAIMALKDAPGIRIEQLVVWRAGAVRHLAGARGL